MKQNILYHYFFEWDVLRYIQQGKIPVKNNSDGSIKHPCIWFVNGDLDRYSQNLFFDHLKSTRDFFGYELRGRIAINHFKGLLTNKEYLLIASIDSYALHWHCLHHENTKKPLTGLYAALQPVDSSYWLTMEVWSNNGWVDYQQSSIYQFNIKPPLKIIR